MKKTGKKTGNLPLKEKSEAAWTVNSIPTNRNLTKKDLGAVIFGCKNHTINECLKKMMFGLPAGHFPYVKNVSPGLILFLFNYSDRTLHGIFEATSCGKMNINPHAWITSEGSEYTPYAAQVQVGIRKKCRPLFEEEFKPLIAKNYYSDRLFWFELDIEQTRKLTKLFSSPELPKKMPPRPPNAARSNNAFNVLLGSNVDEAADKEFENIDSKEYSGTEEMNLKENQHSYASIVSNRDAFAPEKKWTELFKASSSSSLEKKSDVLVSSSLMSKPPPEPCPDTVVECWEEHAVFDNDAKEMYENMVTQLLYPEQESELTESCERDHNQPNSMDTPENINATYGGVVTDTESSVSESVIIKLTQELEELKVSQLKQTLKIDSLQHQLVYSKLEIDQLKRRCHKLEFVPSSAIDYYALEYCQPPNITAQESVLIVGGFDGDSWLPDLSLYSPPEDHEISLCPMTCSRSYASVAKLNGDLYIFGGVDDGIWYDTVESYNPMSNKWVQRPSLSKKKGSLAGASLYEKIYAIGGGNGVECFSEVELLDLNIGSWIPAQSMLEKLVLFLQRFSHAAADINGVLYVAGGYNGRDYLRSVERFDPREHAWTRLGSMNVKRGCHSLVAFKERLYALGGYNGDTMVSTVDVLDPRFGSWLLAEPMKVSRGYFGSFVFGGKIHVIGGLEGTEVLDVTECYDEGSGWQVGGRTAIGKRSYFSTLVL
ncbi:hypothetical protein ACP275_06G063000 [Erythranthe tilingii]